MNFKWDTVISAAVPSPQANGWHCRPWFVFGVENDQLVEFRVYTVYTIFRLMFKSSCPKSASHTSWIFFGVQITMITFFAAVIAMSFSHIWPFSPVIRFHWFHWSFPLMLHTTRKRNLALALNGFMNLGPLASSNQIWQAGKSSIEFGDFLANQFLAPEGIYWW